MNARNVDESRNSLATGIKTAALIVVLGTIAAVLNPLNMSNGQATTSVPSSASADTGPDMSAYFPSRFAAPENIEPQAPTF